MGMDEGVWSGEEGVWSGEKGVGSDGGGIDGSVSAALPGPVEAGGEVAWGPSKLLGLLTEPFPPEPVNRTRKIKRACCI